MNTDLISIADAARLIGKSQQTVRRYKRDGRIDFVTVPGDKRSYLSRSAILTLAGQRSQPIESPIQKDIQPDSQALDIMRSHLEDTRKQRDSLVMQVNDLRSQLQDKQRRIEALERELNGGVVRGLLRGIRTRL